MFIMHVVHEYLVQIVKIDIAILAKDIFSNYSYI